MGKQCNLQNEILYQLALTLIPQIGPVQAKILLAHFGNASAILQAKAGHLKNIEGIGESRAYSIKKFSGFQRAEEELNFIEKYGIRPLFLTDPAYPQRLLNCYDSPTLLFYKGNADLNISRIVAIIGTRNHTEYGKQLTDKLVRGLIAQGVLVISGLAYGIDALAHKNALKHAIPTVGVLAHGLDQVYPAFHSALAKDMIRNGGLLTEYWSGTDPDKHNFPTRNRIVAGMSDATIVIETGSKGGSMITAELANGYNKDVFAYPGRVTDHKSEGCNQLIRQNKAMLITEPNDLLEIMGWIEVKKTKPALQKEIFIELSENEKTILDILKEKENTHIDEINLKANLSSSAVAAAILNLELQNIIASLPGKMYSLQ